MAEAPITDERHDDEEDQSQRRDDDGADEFRAAGEVFQELEKEKEIPFGPSGRERFGGIGRSAEFGPERSAGIAQAWKENEEQNCREDCHASNRIFEHLIGPELCVGFAQRFFRSDAMTTEQINM